MEDANHGPRGSADAGIRNSALQRVALDCRGRTGQSKTFNLDGRPDILGVRGKQAGQEEEQEADDRWSGAPRPC